MLIYIDSKYKCHNEPAADRREFELPFFSGRCRAFTEGYSYLPPGESFTGKNGAVYRGEMLWPHSDHEVLEAVQRQYEQDEAEKQDMRQALNMLGVE